MNFKFKLKFNKREVSNHLLFCYFSYSMKGNIYRVTYNAIKQEAVLHMQNGDVAYIPMSEEEWSNALKGNLIENFKKILSDE